MVEVTALRNQMMEPSLSSTEPALETRPPRLPFMNRWALLAFLVLAGVSGIAGASAVSLLRIPNLPNCRAIFWPTASAATRLQCADAYAEQGSAEDLLAAIALVEALPSDHPLRADIDERVETWAEQILAIAERTFHQGDLEEALKIARKIPRNTAAADTVSDRIATWETTWEQAESIFREAENHLKASKFQEAFAAAVQLRTIDNDYWSTTRYETLLELISTTRDDFNALADAERLAQGGTVEAVLEALEKVAAISQGSYMYEQAQRILKDLSRQLLDLAEDALAREDRSEALTILESIPSAAKLTEEIADFRILVDAYELTWADTTVGYESAIVRLQSIGRDRPLYSKAQSLQRRWQWELEAVAQLNWAKQVAVPGTVDDLWAAIAEAEGIPPSNPLWEETQTQIQRWRDDIAAIEDQPLLDRARAIASQGNQAALQAAIAEVSTIALDSPLYGEAQEAIAEWRWQIQTIDNEPLLAEARRLAGSGRIEQAIAVASQILPEQALYEEAQAEIADWQTDQQQLQGGYQQAVATAQSSTVDALVNAITIAQSVPETSADWSLAQQAANQWSWTLLQMAEDAASQVPADGVAIAGQIPPRTEAYAQAQLRIREWQQANQ